MYLSKPGVRRILGQSGDSYSSLFSSSMVLGVGTEAVDKVPGTGEGAVVDDLLCTMYDEVSSRFAYSSFTYDKDTAGLETVRTWRKSFWFPYSV